MLVMKYLVTEARGDMTAAGGALVGFYVQELERGGICQRRMGDEQ
jgi:hypothetical protein